MKETFIKRYRKKASTRQRKDWKNREVEAGKWGQGGFVMCGFK